MNRDRNLQDERNEFIRKVAEKAESTTRAVEMLSRRLYLSERRIWHIITEATDKRGL